MTTSPETSAPSSTRLESVDQFRGFAIISMILANYAGAFAIAPWWLKHPEGGGHTFNDVVAPLFIFIIGLLYARTYERRCRRDGVRRATLHVLKRYVLLFIIGLGLSLAQFFAVEGAAKYVPDLLSRVGGGVEGARARARFMASWGVLQAIGCAGLLTLVLIRLDRGVRLLAAVLLLLFYQFMLGHGWMPAVTQRAHGGVPGCLSWAAMLILSTCIGEDLKERQRLKTATAFLVFGVLLTFLGLRLSTVWPLSKREVSASYAVLSVGLSSLIFLLFFILVDCLRIRIPSLTVLGRNPLVLYVVHTALVGGAIALIGADGLLWQVGLGGAAIYLACYGLAYLLHRKEAYVRL